MWPNQKVGGGEVEISPSLCFPPKHLINSLKERCNVFCIYTCLTLRWKVICSCHHSKLIKNEMTGLSRAVRSRCSVMGCRSYRLNFSRGRGQRGEREQSTITVEQKLFWLKHCYTYIQHHMIIRLNLNRIHVFIFVILIIWMYFSCRFRIEKEYTALKSKENEDQIELRVKFSLYGVFMVTLINELSAKKLLNWVSCNLFLHLVKRNFEFFLEILVINFCNFIKKYCIWQRKLQRIDKNNDKEWKHLLSFWVLWFGYNFFFRG